MKKNEFKRMLKLSIQNKALQYLLKKEEAKVLTLDIQE